MKSPTNSDTVVQIQTGKYFSFNSNSQEIEDVNPGVSSTGRSNYRFSDGINRNVASDHAALRTQFSQEVEGVCGNNFEILEISSKETTHQSYKKPIVEGSFICK